MICEFLYSILWVFYCRWTKRSSQRTFRYRLDRLVRIQVRMVLRDKKSRFQSLYIILAFSSPPPPPPPPLLNVHAGSATACTCIRYFYFHYISICAYSAIVHISAQSSTGNGCIEVYMHGAWGEEAQNIVANDIIYFCICVRSTHRDACLCRLQLDCVYMHVSLCCN